eukprot:4503531-Amphidinium_carterae.3
MAMRARTLDLFLNFVVGYYLDGDMKLRTSPCAHPLFASELSKYAKQNHGKLYERSCGGDTTNM